jgi:hypothetical protein
MESEPTERSPYLPATSPDWVQYYKRAKETRRLGKGQYSAIQRDTKRRRRQANLALVGSTALLLAVIAAFFAILGGDHAPSEGSGNVTPSRSADARRG